MQAKIIGTWSQNTPEMPILSHEENLDFASIGRWDHLMHLCAGVSSGSRLVVAGQSLSQGGLEVGTHHCPGAVVQFLVPEPIRVAIESFLQQMGVENCSLDYDKNG
jgi:hypothetical protein